ncbi:WYL domain-containing protein [Leptolyngbya sp. NK1-12]|uniref:WYL domain-containing protein n=1 Tax=Leptolyngbya sp. NK1-12 TaxID=2547451 RepID=A0AA97AG33_9CYAN|nr:WYL domain-containing protein [Leptolyngbya sp. NK1-12]WNZ23865.1 WYL domain-containing protein [Leptolyngbya sp. NK1-12]
MAKPPDLHSYSDRASFERLLLLMAALVKQPGVGAGDKTERIAAVQQQMQTIAAELKISLPWYAEPTLQKDLGVLRRYGILDRQIYRHGYYVGTGVMTSNELRLALNALASQAKYQGDAQARQAYQAIGERLQGQKFESEAAFYPVRLQFNRPTTYTDPDEMMRKQAFRNTLFHQLEQVEVAILQGLPLEVYAHKRGLYESIYPLQLLYHDVAWYLLCEEMTTGHLMTYRMDRLANYARPLAQVGRGIAAQQESLQAVHQLLKTGWGLFLGTPKEQKRERQGLQEFEQIRVRFYDETIPLILEAERRHPKQKLRVGKLDADTGLPLYVDYKISLPPRSLPEFGLWLNRYMGNVRVLAPTALLEQQQQGAKRLLERYQNSV